MKHTCHWPGCPEEVPPKMWGCRKHWFTLPKTLRDLIWMHYRPGQEEDKNPSEEYLRAADKVQVWCKGYIAGVRHAQKDARLTGRI